ncbi:MAG TPA: ABC transporter permease, partial [Methylomirabilota bacterium]|nr:ABC transporter permease [Methylomirabilota bacterium]
MSPSTPGGSPGRLAWRAFRRNGPAVVGLVVVLGFFALALVGLALTTGTRPVLDPREVRLPDRLRAPFARPAADQPRAQLPRLGIYLLGTDELGRDVFARMLEGAFVSLSVGFVAVGLAVGIGIVVGGVAGYYGPTRLGVGRLRLLTVDTLVTGLIDVMLSFPTFFLILTVVAVLKPSIWNIMVVIGLTSWEGTARFVRAEILSLR